MRLLRDKSHSLEKATLDLNLTQLNSAELDARVKEFQPDVIISLADSENEATVELALRYNCHIGLFKPYKNQIDETKLDMSRQKQLAKIIFLDQCSTEVHYFENFGRVIHQDYLAECTQLLNFFFFCDADAFD